MKKRLHIMMNEKAFYLPYVLIISIITLSLITTSIMIYQNELSVTNKYIEQIEIETLIQMARAKFKEEVVYNEQTKGQVNYEFPNGVVNITYEYITDKVIHLHFNAVTNKQFTFEGYHELTIESSK